MKIAITGGTGFLGGHLADRLRKSGHNPILVARSERRKLPTGEPNGMPLHAVGLDDPAALAAAFTGCEAVAHCAGINREIGSQTYRRVHVEGTQNVVEAARAAGVKRIALISFLRARPDCGSGYHESKWAAEEIVRQSGLPFTILKPGVIYGKGDHMIDHLTRAFLTFPVFGLVGFRDTLVRPVAVQDVARILEAALTAGRLDRKTVSVLGPEVMTLREAVERVAEVVGKRPRMIRLPLTFHYLLAWTAEKLMTTPLTSLAQVRILSEGIVEALPFAEELPEALRPRVPFYPEMIRAALPPLERFGRRDLLFFAEHTTK